MSEKKRGGAGRGQERKPKTDGGKLVKRQVFLRPEQIEKLQGKNLSVEIRKLIDLVYDWKNPPATKDYDFPKTERRNHFWEGCECLMCGAKRSGKDYFDRFGERLETRPQCDRDTRF